MSTQPCAFPCIVHVNNIGPVTHVKIADLHTGVGNQAVLFYNTFVLMLSPYLGS